ncbi:D-glycero-beta-D-manno-heptose 1-phosphate adenylyltransferase [Candidatus Mcinerneyibacteriota bacterium]|nr:D-glycero-beta-D-manno-heptose 1-phosphate adenylyltransferase [Candidatus Mcinerneyibacteriota bacterium]
MRGLLSKKCAADLGRSFLEEGKKLTFTNGCFDILHIGHIRYLKEAASLGDALLVGLNSDASVKRLKGPGRPVNNEEERAEMLLALRSVDYVVIFDEETPLDLIRAVKPYYLVKGGDWPPESIVGSRDVLARGGKVMSLPFVPGKSTTSLIEKMRKHEEKK